MDIEHLNLILDTLSGATETAQTVIVTYLIFDLIPSLLIFTGFTTTVVIIGRLINKGISAYEFLNELRKALPGYNEFMGSKEKAQVLEYMRKGIKRD